MPYASSLTSYPDIQAALDRALASPRGIRFTFENPQAQMTFCGRIHSFRHLDRKANAKTYPADHPMHGCSAYDALMTKKVGTTQVDILKLEGLTFNSEEL